MENQSPFSQEALNEIFKTSPAHANRILSRENSSLEFKESFGWGSIAKYLRSCAAFANTKGGFIVFGVKNRPHELKGLSGSSLQYFEGIDPEKMSNHFNEHFAPEINWDIHQHELQGKVYGLRDFPRNTVKREFKSPIIRRTASDCGGADGGGRRN